MVRQYADIFERPLLHALVDLLYPRYSPKKALGSALSLLQRKEDPQEAMWLAGKNLASFYESADKFSRKPVELAKLANRPADLDKAIGDALRDSKRKVGYLKKHVDVEPARFACRANRRTILLLVLAWR